MIHDENARPCQEIVNNTSEWNHDESMYLCDECTEAYTPDYTIHCIDCGETSDLITVFGVTWCKDEIACYRRQLPKLSNAMAILFEIEQEMSK